MEKANPLQIAVGIIRNPDNNQIFITKRMERSHLAGYWEFPGGKIEIGESAEQGLFRELQEEIGIDINSPKLLKTLDYRYPEKHLQLHFFMVETWSGQPYGKEGQVSQWMSVDELNADDFPDANREIVALLKQQFLSN